MKVSVCITVFNEEKSIARLLDSLLKQTSKPNEIVIVDGGSKDKTVDIIRHYQKKDKRIKLLIEPGSIARGRNVSIDIARYPVIASTDAGCIAKSDWLEKITEPFKYETVGVVAGFYDMPAKNPMQEAINTFVGVTPACFDPTSFMPSTRSVAFRKNVWEKIGGFSEKLGGTGEDTLFFHNVEKQGVKIVRVKEARVEWRELASYILKDALNKMYYYAKGDAQTKIWYHSTKQFASHNIKITLIFARYILGLGMVFLAFSTPLLWLILAFGLFFYISWAFRKVYDQTNNFTAGLWGIIVQFGSDLAVMAGFLNGILVEIVRGKK